MCERENPREKNWIMINGIERSKRTQAVSPIGLCSLSLNLNVLCARPYSSALVGSSREEPDPLLSMVSFPPQTQQSITHGPERPARTPAPPRTARPPGTAPLATTPLRRGLAPQTSQPCQGAHLKGEGGEGEKLFGCDVSTLPVS